MTTGRFRNIASIVMLALFLLPSVVKLEHHHPHHVLCHDNDKTHFHEHHEKCHICVFEFNIFTSGNPKCRIVTDAPLTNLLSDYNTLFPDISHPFTFLLRGPPVNQI